MKKIYIETLVEDELPKIGTEVMTNHGILYYSEDKIWAREGDYASIPTWWLKETTIEELTAKKVIEELESVQFSEKEHFIRDTRRTASDYNNHIKYATSLYKKSKSYLIIQERIDELKKQYNL